MIIDNFFNDYRYQLNQALGTVDTNTLDNALNVILTCIEKGGTIFVCGNGGSAAIADHLSCDCSKGIRTDTYLHPKVFSLSSNSPLLTAIANDFAYEKVFAYQIAGFMRTNDILITISSSGNSPNIREAIRAAHVLGNKVISFSGFDGGASLTADVHIHVNSHNYGIVEDCHQSIMHILSQYIRITRARDDAELKL